MLRVFDSVGAFAAECPSPGTRLPNGVVVPDESDMGLSWYSGLRHGEAMKQAKLGDSKRVTASEKIIANLECVLPRTQGWETVRSPFGARANMGDWLAGSPTPMRRRVKRNSDVSPIKIVVSITSSAGIGNDTLAQRGAIILAFLMQVQMIRPVELYALIELDGRTDGSFYSMIKIDSKPLNLSQAAFVLGSGGFARHGYNMAYTDHYTGRWPKDHGTSNYDQIRRQRLGLEPQDIVIKEAYLTDPLLTNPEEWIKAELQKITAQTEGE